MSSRRQSRSSSRILNKADNDAVTAKSKSVVPVEMPVPMIQMKEVASDGCKLCGKDNDHSNLLICENCNCEVHTYCVGLTKVPDDDFFCPDCTVDFSMDPLEKLVKNLPENYTKRFGEICWAHGGTGFGWWPACIYDPRLTVGSARELAMKHAGKRHLVYFFECLSAPFTVCRADKITKWEEGITNGFTTGKTARTVSMPRSMDFDKAYAAALCERVKPLDQRMDFNHFEQEAIARQESKHSNGKKIEFNDNAKTAEQKRKRKGSKIKNTESDLYDSNRTNKRARKKKLQDPDGCVEAVAPEEAYFEEKMIQHTEEIKNSSLRTFYGKMSSEFTSKADVLKVQLSSNISVPNVEEDGMCFCKVLLKKPQSFVNIGFIVLTSRW